jgi:ribA/ribD-fused uncharacterized protein
MPIKPPERIDRFEGPWRFLSNFARLPDGTTLEHAYQAAKTLDPDQKLWVFSAPTAAEAKQRGRQVTIRADWETVKQGVMLRLLRQKFTEPSMAQMLLETKGAYLEEGNYWHDQYWGNCTCPAHNYTPGENWLGSLLMQVREELREGTNLPCLEYEWGCSNYSSDRSRWCANCQRREELREGGVGDGRGD